VSQYTQAIAPTLTPPRAHFDRSHSYDTAIDFDYIYPVYFDEVYPGDTFNMQASVFGRFATLLNPLMHDAYIDIHFFYAPMRILWDNARKFWGEQVDPGDSIDYTIPYIVASSSGNGEEQLSDYFTLPTKKTGYSYDAMYHRLYYFSWNEFYRDQNLQDSLDWDTDNGPDLDTDYVLQKRGKRHDYITSGLVNLLKDPATAQTLPLGTSAPILGLGVGSSDTANAGPTNVKVSDGTTDSFANYFATTGDSVIFEEDPNNSDYPYARADLSNATAATILQLRQAIKIQAILELDARAGTRYPEQIYAVYGVRYNGESYRPEFLGGGSTRIDVHQVPQTSNDGTNGDVADLGAFGTLVLNGGFTKSFDEPGYIIGLVSARADIKYQQGLDRLFSRTDRYSMYHPLLQDIGDQATYKREVVCQNQTVDTGSTGTPDNDRVFNYQERYAELKYKPSYVTGRFRSNATQSLDPWHLTEEFTDAEPHFNAAFIQSNTPIDRVIAVNTEPHLILTCEFNLQCARPMYMYSIPGFGSRL
jgi:hypothetical protein